MKQLLLNLAYDQSITVGFNRITRLDDNEWIVNGERLDFEFAMYALSAS